MKDMANRCRHAVSSTAAGAAAWAIASLAAADTVVLAPDKDNTLIQPRRIAGVLQRKGRPQRRWNDSPGRHSL
jgi:hypothetical protein